MPDCSLIVHTVQLLPVSLCTNTAQCSWVIGISCNSRVTEEHLKEDQNCKWAIAGDDITELFLENIKEHANWSFILFSIYKTPSGFPCRYVGTVRLDQIGNVSVLNTILIKFIRGVVWPHLTAMTPRWAPSSSKKRLIFHTYYSRTLLHGSINSMGSWSWSKCLNLMYGSTHDTC